MAHSIFDGLSGVPLIGGPNGIGPSDMVSYEEHVPTISDTDMLNLEEEPDLFLCGQCKKQFSSLDIFMAHKQEHIMVSSFDCDSFTGVGDVHELMPDDPGGGVGTFEDSLSHLDNTGQLEDTESQEMMLGDDMLFNIDQNDADSQMLLEEEGDNSKQTWDVVHENIRIKLTADEAKCIMQAKTPQNFDDSFDDGDTEMGELDLQQNELGQLPPDLHGLPPPYKDISQLQPDLTSDLHQLQPQLQDELHQMQPQLQDELHQMQPQLQDELHQMQPQLQDELHQLQPQLQDELNQLQPELHGLHNNLDQLQTNLHQLQQPQFQSELSPTIHELQNELEQLQPDELNPLESDLQHLRHGDLQQFQHLQEFQDDLQNEQIRHIQGQLESETEQLQAENYRNLRNREFPLHSPSLDQIQKDLPEILDEPQTVIKSPLLILPELHNIQSELQQLQQKTRKIKSKISPKDRKKVKPKPLRILLPKPPASEQMPIILENKQIPSVIVTNKSSAYNSQSKSLLTTHRKKDMSQPPQAIVTVPEPQAPPPPPLPPLIIKTLPPPLVIKKIPKSLLMRKIPPPLVINKMPPPLVIKQTPPSAVIKEVPPLAMKAIPPPLAMKEVPPLIITKTLPSTVIKTSPPSNVTQDLPPLIMKQQLPPLIVKTDLPPTVIQQLPTPVVSKELPSLPISQKLTPFEELVSLEPLSNDQPTVPACEPLELSPILAEQNQLDLPDAEEQSQSSKSPPSISKLSCAFCFKVFTKRFDLEQHIRCHTGEKPFQCIVCGRAFAQKSHVKKHMVTHKVWPSGQFRTLPKEPIQFVDEVKEIYDENNKGVKVIVNSSYVCQFCDKAFTNYVELKSHTKEHYEEKVYRCIQKKCNSTFSDLDEFLLHAHEHENSCKFRCYDCGKLFNSLADLRTHQYAHFTSPGVGKPCGKPKSKVYNCAKCKSKFSTPEALEHHTNTYPHSFMCDLCNKNFSCERYLRRHLQTHDANMGVFSCNICSKEFRFEAYLRAHLVTHSQEKPFTCKICNVSFNRKDKLARHSLMHEKHKRHKCPYRNSLGCTKEFYRQDKLKTHILTHLPKKDRMSIMKNIKTEKEDLNEVIKFPMCSNCGNKFKRHQMQVCPKCQSPVSMSQKMASKEIAEMNNSSRRRKPQRRVTKASKKRNEKKTIEIIVVPISGQNDNQAQQEDDNEIHLYNYEPVEESNTNNETSNNIIEEPLSVPTTTTNNNNMNTKDSNIFNTIPNDLLLSCGFSYDANIESPRTFLLQNSRDNNQEELSLFDQELLTDDQIFSNNTIDSSSSNQIIKNNNHHHHKQSTDLNSMLVIQNFKNFETTTDFLV